MTRKLFLNKFAKIQKSPIQIVDVGARSGLEDNLLFVAENTKTKILAFEPEPIEYSRLLSSKPPNLTLLNTALFSQSGNITLYVTKDPGLTSVYKPKFDYLKSIETEIAFKDYTINKEIKFDASTLDYEAKNNQFEQADFIKLDTEGSEVDILLGAEELLRSSVIGVESEISYVQLREDQLTFSNMLDYLAKMDFHIFDVRNRHQKRPIGQTFGKRKGQLIYCDALFFKTIEGLEKILAKLSNQEQKRDKIYNTLVLISSYGYYDYAFEIFTKFEDLFCEADQDIIHKTFKLSESSLSKFPHFFGRGFVASVFHRLGMILGAGNSANRSAMRFGDQTLGNIDWW